MKKIRLFAIASAMGMFASTVSAAEYVTKDAYVATWGKVDEIIKVDIGDKVVLPTAEINVVKESRTTDPKYGSFSDSLGLEASEKCYAGFTNVEGKDSNGDGYVDAKILTAGTTNLTDQGWLHTDAKFFPTAKTALFYIGLGSGQVTGGRFLAPGAAKKDVYALGLKHAHLEDGEAVLKYFEEQGILKFAYDSKDYIDYVDVNPIVLKDDKGKSLGTVSIRITSKQTRYADDSIKEDIVELLESGKPLTSGSDYTVMNVIAENYDTKEVLPYAAVIAKVNTSISEDSILLVEEDRYGNLIPTGVATGTDIYTSTGAKMAYPGADKIIVALDTDKMVEVGGVKYPAYSKYMTISITSGAANTPKSTMKWDEEAGTFIKNSDAAREYDVDTDSVVGYYWNNPASNKALPKAIAAEDLAVPAHALGLYHLSTPANSSDKIVIDTDGLNLNITGINTKKETISIGYGKDSELTMSAVKLGNKWYPAVTNEADLARFAEKVLGLTNLTGNDFDNWIKDYELQVDNPLSGISMAERTNVNGDKEAYIPENSLQHYKGTFCTYKVADGESVPATITGNTDAVDTSTSGVKTLTLTAKVGDVVVGTKDVKVVVAPKYERVYKNGRVITLKAFHLNGALYAVYNYDWAGKKYTATFYAQDGITVASTANGTL